jgi:hypothetical protein
VKELKLSKDIIRPPAQAEVAKEASGKHGQSSSGGIKPGQGKKDNVAIDPPTQKDRMDMSSGEACLLSWPRSRAMLNGGSAAAQWPGAQKNAPLLRDAIVAAIVDA